MMAAIIQKYLAALFNRTDQQVIDAGKKNWWGMCSASTRHSMIIAVYLVTKVSDSLIEGLKFSKLPISLQQSQKK